MRTVPVRLRRSHTHEASPHLILPATMNGPGTDTKARDNC